MCFEKAKVALSIRDINIRFVQWLLCASVYCIYNKTNMLMFVITSRQALFYINLTYFLLRSYCHERCKFYISGKL